MPHKTFGPIFLAEDTPSIRETIADGLRTQGFVVHTAADGVEALDLIKGTPGPYFVLLTDLDMPRKNGDDLIREVDASNFPFSAYVLISGYGETHPSVQALRAASLRKPFHFLPKPFTDEALRELLLCLRNEPVDVNTRGVTIHA